MLTNSRSNYGSLTKLIHWVVALTVFCMFALGLWMVDLDYYDSWYTAAPHYHKSVGILLASVMLVRLVLRISNPIPAPLATHQLWEQRSAHWAHRILYLLIFLIITSGYLISTADGRPIEVFDWFEIPPLGSFVENQEDLAGTIHLWLAYLLIALVTVHALAALKHHFIDKDLTLKRII